MIYPEEPFDLNDYIRRIEEKFNKYCDKINDNFESAKKKRIEVKFKTGYDEISINAKAVESKETFIFIECSFYRALEKIYKTLFNENNSEFYKMISQDEEYDRSKVNSYLWLMIELSISLVILHELGHIFNGHLLCKKDLSPNKDAAMEENPSDTAIDNEINPILIQAMECDADDFSAVYIVAFHCHKFCIERLNAKNKLIKSEKHMLLLILAASIISFSILGLGKNNKDNINKDYKKESHLPGRYRISRLLKKEVEQYATQNESKDKLENSEYLSFSNGIESIVNMYMEKIIINNANNIVEDEKWSIYNNVEELNEEHKKYYSTVEEYINNNLPGALSKYDRFLPTKHVGTIYEYEDIFKMCGENIFKITFMNDL